MPEQTVSFKNGFVKATREFCINTNFHGFKYIVQETSGYARTFWFLVTITNVCLTLFLIYTLWNIFMDNPTVTTLEDTAYPVENIDFPAISVCNLNKISRRHVKTFAEDVANATRQTYKEIFKYMELLGSLYDNDVSKIDELTTFQLILDKYHHAKKDYNEYTNIKDMMTMLTPSCDDVMRNCYWGNEKQDCDKLFTQRLTYEGYCCSFNYLKQTPGVNITMTKPYRQTSGVRQGLTFTVNVDLDDYFYTIMSSEGVLHYSRQWRRYNCSVVSCVLLFFLIVVVHLNVRFFSVSITNPYDFPDQASGSFSEVLVGVGLETFLEIVPLSVYSVDDIQRYPLEKRGCRFDTEATTIFGLYSESDCLVDCRINSIWFLCQCVPFLYPIQQNKPVCTLADVHCINKYQGKWNSLYPAGDIEQGVLEREKTDSLRCPNRCYPSCDGEAYAVYVNSVPISFNNNFSADGQIQENESVVHLYYGNPLCSRYKTDVVYYWFEILSSFGGISGLTIGFSLLNAVELLIYFTYKFIYYSYHVDT